MAESLRPDIQAAKDKMQHRLGAGREMKRLTNHLWQGESVHLMAAGRYGGGTGVVVLTTTRLLFVMDGMTRQTIEDFPLDKISSVQWSSGMVLGTMTVYASGNKADIDQMNKRTANRSPTPSERGLPTPRARTAPPHHREVPRHNRMCTNNSANSANCATSVS